MIVAKIWKAGNSYVVTIPREELEARGLQVGQTVGIDPIPLELRAVDPLTREQRTAGWKTQLEVERDVEARMESDCAAGLLTPEEVAKAEQDIDQEAEWVKRL